MNFINTNIHYSAKYDEIFLTFQKDGCVLCEEDDVDESTDRYVPQCLLIKN